MPLMHILTTAGLFDAPARDALIHRLTAASWRAESVPDNPETRLRSIALHDELPAGRAYCGGLVADGFAALVLVTYTAGEGVLDPVRRARFAADLEDAARATCSGLAGRRLVTSVTFNEVPEGRWGREGRIVRLPQMVAEGGFEHLTEIAVPAG